MSGETEFTPGPWVLDEAGYPYEKAVSAASWAALARVIVKMDPDGLGRTSEKTAQGEANARLIAAAPDLYEALCDMVSDHSNLSKATLAFARRALAKAVKS